MITPAHPRQIFNPAFPLPGPIQNQTPDGGAPYLILYAYVSTGYVPGQIGALCTILPIVSAGLPVSSIIPIFNLEAGFTGYPPAVRAPQGDSSRDEQLTNAVAGNKFFDALAGWTSPQRAFTAESGAAADQYTVISLNNIINNVWNGSETMFPPLQKYMSMTIITQGGGTLYLMCATVGSLYGFSFNGDNLGLTVTDLNGNAATMFQIESMFGSDPPPGFNTRTDFPNGGVSSVPNIYSPTSTLPFVDVSNFTAHNPLNLGLSNLNFDVA
jgi:hypothetical protein